MNKISILSILASWGILYNLHICGINFSADETRKKLIACLFEDSIFSLRTIASINNGLTDVSNLVKMSAFGTNISILSICDELIFGCAAPEVTSFVTKI